MSGFRVLTSQVVYEGHLARVRIDEVWMPDGAVAQREVVERPDAVAVVPVTADREVVLLRQYRHALGERLLEIPAGLLDVDGESYEDAAQRELVEEVGLAAGTLEPLVRFANSAGWSDEQTTVFLATDLRPASPPDTFAAVHEEADMEVVRLPLAETVAAAQRGEIIDAKTLIGLLVAGDRLGIGSRAPG